MASGNGNGRSEAGAEHPCVLVVDDERGPRESLRMILSPGFRVLQTSSGTEALEILRRETIDLVTLDLNMPGMKGEQLMRTLRSEFPEVEIIVITGCGSVDSAAEGVRQGICDYLQKPFDVVQVTAAALRGLERHRARGRLTRFLEQLGDMVGRDRETRAILGDVQRSQKLKTRLGGLLETCAFAPGADGAPLDPTRTVAFLEVLAETIETKDRFMRGHARRVAFFSGLLADRLELRGEEREQVRIAAFLHDLGKVGVPTDLLLRAGALDPGERAVVEQHPEIGARLLKPLDIPDVISRAVRHHHEWWDGTGYPDGLAGEEIPLAARIIGVADAFDAMSCDRPYRRALGHDFIHSEFERYADVQFDPRLAKELLLILETGALEVDPMLIAEATGGPPAALAALAALAAAEG